MLPSTFLFFFLLLVNRMLVFALESRVVYDISPWTSFHMFHFCALANVVHDLSLFMSP